VVNFGGNYETQRKVYTGAATGTPLETIITCYNGNTSNCATAQSVVPGGEINVFRSLNGGPNSEVDTFYNTRGLVTAKNEYDFGATTPIRKTTTTYDSTIGNGVLDRPSVVTVTDGSGNIKSQTTYTYDEDEVAGTLKASGASQLSAVTCTASSGKCRGNATTVVSWLNSGATLTKKFVHYDTGQAYTATDVNGAVTQYTYGNCGNSLLTNVSLPLSLSQSSSWNCTGGVMTSSTDTNGKTSYTNYTTDPYFWRPESTKDQLGNITNLTYPSLIRSESSLELNSTSYVDVVTSLDTLGRSSLSQTRQGVGSSYFDTAFQTYDSAGRPYKTFMPCQAAEGSGCSTPSTTTTYDGMARPLTVTDGGGGTTTYTYTKNDVLIKVSPAPAGENIKQRQLEYDGLGRLTSVCEITSASGSGSGSCGQSNAEAGLLTKYTYDALDNLLTVAQNAQPGAVGGSQTRTYTYDGLSRLTSETNPETSNLATTYTYDYDPGGDSCASGARNTPGDMLKKVDPNGHYTCYIYDKLHRVTDVGNSLQGYSYSPVRRFRYDSPSNGVQPQPPSSTITNVGGRLVEVETDSGSMITDEWFSYDNDGRQTDAYEKTPNSGGYYHSTASYWANNQQETLGIMNSTGVALIPLQTYGVDGEGRINSVKPASGYIPASSVTYATTGTTEPIGSLTQITFGSGDSDSYQYDTNTGRMTQYSFNVNGQSAVGKLTWNANGTLQKLAITDPFNSQDNQTCTNAYDDLSRVSSNSCGSLWAQTFTYDAFGNLTKNGTSAWVPGYNGSTNHYTLAGTSYDANGNLLNDTFNTYTWNAYGDLASANGIALTYDALDRMVENANGASQFVYGPNGQHQLANMVGQQLASAFVPLPAGAVAVYYSSGLVQYNHADWLGSARLFSTPSRTATPAMAYAPFGEGYAGGSAYVQFTSYGNQWTVSDGENSGGSLDDFIFRRYSPGQGRWISPDPAGVSAVDPSNPQSWNRYSYVLNNPLGYTDPLGLFCVWDDGSYDSNDDSGTGSQSSCEDGNGGTWFNGSPSDWSPGASDWSGQASGTFAGWAQAINPSVGDFGDPTGTPDASASGMFTPVATTTSSVSGSLAGTCPAQPLAGNPPVTTEFGATDASHPQPHTGRDYAVPVGTPVFAPYAGSIGFAGSAGTFGNLVVITNPVWNVYFGHLSSILVATGNQVNAGDQVGLSGNSGHSTGPHLHFEQHTAGPIWQNGHAPRGTAVEPCH
jgi:RHS repeat-associated protein